ncbi:MAG: PAS domain S-box protein, partial [Ignavibacteriales bacterium]|nr:PAS domain S-box protein [Ignavibacteriales bacterium]
MRIRQWIGKYFHAPILEDENDTRTVRILFHICSALVVGLGAILLLRVAFMQFELVFPIALMAISAGLTIVLISRKYVTAAKHFFLLTLLSFLLFLVFKSDGIHDTALLAFPGLLVIASILLVRSAYVIFTGVVLASVALLGYLEIAHSIVTPFSWRTNIFDVTDVLVILGVTAVTIRLLADGLFQTLAKIRQNQLDLKNRAEDLRESNERFARLADASFEGIVVSDNGIIVDLNNQLADMLGYTQSEMIGRSVVDFVPPQDVVQVVSPVRSNDEEPYEQCALRKDGSVLPVEIHAKSTFMGNHPVRVSAIRDISEQKRAEIEKKQMQAQILQTQKIDSIGTLAAGIAHDFNNLLNIIIGNSDLIDARPSDVAKVAQRNDAIRGAAQRGAKLVRQLLTFARKTKIELRPVLLNTIV